MRHDDTLALKIKNSAVPQPEACHHRWQYHHSDTFTTMSAASDTKTHAREPLLGAARLSSRLHAADTETAACSAMNCRSDCLAGESGRPKALAAAQDSSAAASLRLAPDHTPLEVAHTLDSPEYSSEYGACVAG